MEWTYTTIVSRAAVLCLAGFAVCQPLPPAARNTAASVAYVGSETCGGCHQRQVNAVPRSTMTTSAVFWAAVSYANGLVSRKQGLLGESYDRAGRCRG